MINERGFPWPLVVEIYAREALPSPFVVNLLNHERTTRLCFLGGIACGFDQSRSIRLRP